MIRPCLPLALSFVLFVSFLPFGTGLALEKVRHDKAAALVQEGEECTDQNGAKYSALTCVMCTTYQDKDGNKCAYSPNTGTCGKASARPTWLKLCPPEFWIDVNQDAESCKPGPCLNEITAETPFLEDDDEEMLPVTDLMYGVNFVVNMFRDKKKYQSKSDFMCATAIENAQTPTLVASQQLGDYTLMAKHFASDVKTELGASEYYEKGIVSLRGTTRGPAAIFNKGFTSANDDPNHPKHSACNGGKKTWKRSDFELHQQNTDDSTYCNIISTSPCLGVAANGQDKIFVYAVVIPEGYMFYEEKGTKDINAEIMAIHSIPKENVYAVRVIEKLASAENARKIDSLFDDPDGLIKVTTPSHWRRFENNVRFNPNFNVVLSDSEEAALQKLLHMECDDLPANPDDDYTPPKPTLCRRAT